MEELCALGRKRVRQIHLLYMGIWGRRGDRPYYSGGSQNSSIVTTWHGGRGRAIESGFLCSYIPRPFSFTLFFRPWDTTICTLASHFLIYIYFYTTVHSSPNPEKKNKDSSLTASSGLCFLMKFPMLRKIYNKYICVLSS